MRFLTSLVAFFILVGTAASAQPAAANERQFILLAGQSNMAGRGVVEPQDRESHTRVMMLDRSLTWLPTGKRP